MYTTCMCMVCRTYISGVLPCSSLATELPSQGTNLQERYWPNPFPRLPPPLSPLRIKANPPALTLLFPFLVGVTKKHLGFFSLLTLAASACGGEGAKSNHGKHTHTVPRREGEKEPIPPSLEGGTKWVSIHGMERKEEEEEGTEMCLG